MRARAALVAATLAASSTLFLAASAGPRISGYADGAPTGFSGGFGEPSCHACHFDADLDSGPGRVSLAGLPDRFVPGQRYPVTVTLRRAGMKLAGFQLTARLEGDGTQAGALAPAPGEEARIGIELQNGVQYASQRRPGTAPGMPDTATWSLIWTAPDPAGPVVFHLAANAANGDDTAEGDAIHTAAVTIGPGRPR